MPALTAGRATAQPASSASAGNRSDERVDRVCWHRPWVVQKHERWPELEPASQSYSRLMSSLAKAFKPLRWTPRTRRCLCWHPGGRALQEYEWWGGLGADEHRSDQSVRLCHCDDPTAVTTVYAGTSGGVFKSNNGADNWGPVNTGLADPVVMALAIDPDAPATLYAGTTFGVYKTTSGGGSWTFRSKGLPGVLVKAIAVAPRSPQDLVYRHGWRWGLHQ